MSQATDDIVEIQQLIHRLCQALDFSKPDDFVEVFVPEGVFRAVTSDATGNTERFSHRGSAALLAFAHDAALKRQGLGRHWTGNVVVSVDQDTATAVSYVLFVQIDPDTAARLINISGVHRDSFVRTPAGWKFTERTIVADL